METDEMQGTPAAAQETSEKTEAVPSSEGPAKPKKKKRTRTIRAALIITGRNFWSFFWFEAVYKLLTFSLAIPLIRRLTSLILYFNGISNLTDDNFLHMLINPVTWIGFIIMIVFAGTMISIEFAGLLSGIHASDQGRKISVREMFMNGFAGCSSVFHIKNWMYLVYVILVIPLAGIGETATLTGSLTLPGFILEWLNEKWYLQAVYLIGMFALTYLALRWIYIVPEMNVRHKSFKEAAETSSQFMHKRILKAVWALLVCYACLFLLLGLTAAVLGGSAFLIIHWLDPGVDLVNCIEPIVITVIVLVYILFILMSPPLVFSRIYAAYKWHLAKTEQELPAYTVPAGPITASRTFKIVLSACIALGIFFFLPGRYQEVKLILTNAANQTLVMAHRGDSVDAPENTLPAFQAAIDHGADAAEMDVQMTKDGTIVVLHDSSIDRTSTGSGNIWDVTYDEIKDLDNGSFFSPEFADTRIPTLDQVIKLCKGKLYLNIEIKRTGHDEGIEQKVLDIIKDNHFQDQCDITSMDYDTLVNVRRLDSTVKTVYTTTVAVGNVSDLSAADAFSVETTFVTQSFVRSMRQNGKQLFVWTVNNEDEMERMIQLGVNAIITNDPVSCRAIVTEAQDAGVFGILSRLRTGVLGS